MGTANTKKGPLLPEVDEATGGINEELAGSLALERSILGHELMMDMNTNEFVDESMTLFRLIREGLLSEDSFTIEDIFDLTPRIPSMERRFAFSVGKVEEKGVELPCSFHREHVLYLVVNEFLDYDPEANTFSVNPIKVGLGTFHKSVDGVFPSFHKGDE